ncbi:hypothetical protein [Aurantimonas sp. VKM B-3413]|uniref:hypothetical protein n=1 Tax=Aurantimonas sp. VKM B-3413 TaxID=2779401 RepID=UPI001E516278|nr:hypothetical protein [Aurantimonas sp. VKM B-3413]MCB8835918.1 hypothetical protein [Aurantimonas sp. VKM B-3413]
MAALLGLLSQPKWIVIGLVAAVAGIWLAWSLHSAKDGGRQAERTTTINQNRETGNAGENARLDRRECVTRGLRWDFTPPGKCLGNP